MERTKIPDIIDNRTVLLKDEIKKLLKTSNNAKIVEFKAVVEKLKIIQVKDIQASLKGFVVYGS